MIISGIQNTTLLDYPGKVAATVFTGGCNFRCPFCHNGELVLERNQALTTSELLAFLRKRKNVLEGVCITGGEPTIQKDLMEILCQIKSLGYSIKLDTNGSSPKVIKALYEGHLIDYIAMDIKAAPERYEVATGIAGMPNMNFIFESAQYIMECGIEYEFRTTLVKGIHEKDEMAGIQKIIEGANAYYLQTYKESDNILAAMVSGAEKLMEYAAFSKDEMEYFLQEACRFSNAYLRGID